MIFHSCVSLPEGRSSPVLNMDQDIQIKWLVASWQPGNKKAWLISQWQRVRVTQSPGKPTRCVTVHKLPDENMKKMHSTSLNQYAFHFTTSKRGRKVPMGQGIVLGCNPLYPSLCRVALYDSTRSDEFTSITKWAPWSHAKCCDENQKLIQIWHIFRIRIRVFPPL